MTSPETRIAAANVDSLTDSALVIGFGPELPAALSAPFVFHQNLRAHRESAGSSFGAWLETEERFNSAVIELPKAVGRLRMLLAMARNVLPSGARVLLAGHNDVGIRSAGKVLAEMIGETVTLDTRYHCRVYAATLSTPQTSTLQSWRTLFDDAVAGRELRIVSYPGVFAHGHIDEGTRTLLEAIEVPSGARVLDVGSGNGVIGAFARAQGATVECVDVDAVAVAASSETLDHVDGPPARAYASDLYTDVGKGYTHILANIPFHAGVKRTFGIAVPLIRGARDVLTRDGHLYAVASKQLDLSHLLAETFGTSRIVRDTGRFRVWTAP